MILNKLAVNLPAYEQHKVPKELLLLEKIDVGESTCFFIAQDLLRKFRFAALQDIPTQYFRETICRTKTVIANIEFHYWNTFQNIGLTVLQFQDKILEAIIHHTRLLYVDLRGLVVMNGIPLERMFNISRMPYGVFLDVTTV